MFTVILRSLGAFLIFNNLVETVDRIERNRQNCLLYMGYFLHLQVEFHSKVIRCISDFRQPYMSKRAGHTHREKWTPVWPQRYLLGE